MNPNWATKIDCPYIPNFYRVADNLFRGARPAAHGCEALKFFGVKTIIDLEAWFDFNLFEWMSAKSNGIDYIGLPCSPWHPEVEDVERFLALASDSSRWPVFVHCRQGSDRTGTMAALYRVTIQRWTKADAIDEMVNGPYGFHGAIWPEIVPFIEGYPI